MTYVWNCLEYWFVRSLSWNWHSIKGNFCINSVCIFSWQHVFWFTEDRRNSTIQISYEQLRLYCKTSQYNVGKKCIHTLQSKNISEQDWQNILYNWLFPRADKISWGGSYYFCGVHISFFCEYKTPVKFQKSN